MIIQTAGRGGPRPPAARGRWAPHPPECRYAAARTRYRKQVVGMSADIPSSPATLDRPQRRYSRPPLRRHSPAGPTGPDLSPGGLLDPRRPGALTTPVPGPHHNKPTRQSSITPNTMPTSPQFWRVPTAEAVRGQMLEGEAAVVVEERVGDTHVRGASESGGLRLVDAGRPAFDQALGDHHVQRPVRFRRPWSVVG